MQPSLNRRSFLGKAAGTGALVAGAPYIWTSARAKELSANDGVGVLAIGVRGRGAAVAVGSCRFGRVVACCDVDTTSRDKFLGHLAEVQSQKPAFYRDYRKALEHPGVDVVTIGTPDHWHSKILIDAVRAGKDVYVEKPMSLTIDEGKVVCGVVRKTGRVVQVGTQQRSEYDGIFLKAVALARRGSLGEKLTATVRLPSQYGKDTGPFAVADPPSTLDWDMWLGQVPLLPYCARRCHGSWRNWVETGYGPLSDWGVHHVDIAQWALGAESTGPLTIVGKGVWPRGREETLAVLLGRKPSTSLPNGYSTVVDYHAELEFANGNTIKIERLLNSWEGGKHRVGLEIAGERGSIWASRGGPNFELTGKVIDEIRADRVLDDALTEEAIRLYRGKTPRWTDDVKRIGDIVPTAHMRNFIECCADRSQPISDVWTHHRATTSCLLANISMLVDRRITWDPVKEQIVGDDEANALLGRRQRAEYAIDNKG